MAIIKLYTAGEPPESQPENFWSYYIYTNIYEHYHRCVIPHTMSHTEPEWLKKFNQYYANLTCNISAAVDDIQEVEDKML